MNWYYLDYFVSKLIYFIRMCDGRDFNQLLWERQISHAEEAARRPMLFKVFLEQVDDWLRVFLRILKFHQKWSTASHKKQKPYYPF